MIGACTENLSSDKNFEQIPTSKRKSPIFAWISSHHWFERNTAQLITKFSNSWQMFVERLYGVEIDNNSKNTFFVELSQTHIHKEKKDRWLTTGDKPKNDNSRLTMDKILALLIKSLTDDITKCKYISWAQNPFFLSKSKIYYAIVLALLRTKQI